MKRFAFKRLIGALSITLAALLGGIAGLGTNANVRAAGLTCSDLVGCTGGNGCGGSGLADNNCVLTCSDGGIVHCDNRGGN